MCTENEIFRAPAQLKLSRQDIRDISILPKALLPIVKLSLEQYHITGQTKSSSAGEGFWDPAPTKSSWGALECGHGIRHGARQSAGAGSALSFGAASQSWSSHHPARQPARPRRRRRRKRDSALEGGGGSEEGSGRKRSEDRMGVQGPAESEEQTGRAGLALAAQAAGTAAGSSAAKQAPMKAAREHWSPPARMLRRTASS